MTYIYNNLGKVHFQYPSVFSQNQVPRYTLRTLMYFLSTQFIFSVRIWILSERRYILSVCRYTFWKIQGNFFKERGRKQNGNTVEEESANQSSRILVIRSRYAEHEFYIDLLTHIVAIIRDAYCVTLACIGNFAPIAALLWKRAFVTV